MNNNNPFCKDYPVTKEMFPMTGGNENLGDGLHPLDHIDGFDEFKPQTDKDKSPFSYFESGS